MTIKKANQRFQATPLFASPLNPVVGERMMRTRLIISLFVFGCVSASMAAPEASQTDGTTRSNLVAGARKYALETPKCQEFLRAIASDPQVNTNRPLDTVEVHEPTRTVRFIHNRIPCDGPMHTITIILNADGTFRAAETNTMFGAEINPEPVNTSRKDMLKKE